MIDDDNLIMGLMEQVTAEITGFGKLKLGCTPPIQGHPNYLVDVTRADGGCVTISFNIETQTFGVANYEPTRKIKIFLADPDCIIKLRKFITRIFIATPTPKWL